jgi:hypothetical protein
MDTIDLESKSSVNAAGPFSKLACLFSFSGLAILLYVALYSPIDVSPYHVVSPWWTRSFFMAGNFMILGLCCCAMSLWRDEMNTLFKAFGLFLNFVVMFLIGGAVVVIRYPELYV